MTAEQTSFLLLGALVALAIVLVAFAIFVGVLVSKGIGYFGRFIGFQAGRDDKDKLTATFVIDETPVTSAAKPSVKPTKKRARGALVVDKSGHPIPAKDLRN